MEAREYSADLISKKIGQLVSDPRAPCFLSGDLNSTKEEQTYKILIDSGLADSEDKAATAKPNSTFTGFDDESSEVIDFIFVRNVDKVALYDVVTEKRPNGRNLSDHRPVYITVDLN